jgi:hypothetical protein
MVPNEKQSTTRLLSAGIIAGPFYIIVSHILAFTREGFDYVRHPASLLSLGDGGWMQIVDFVVSGLLFLAGGIGLGRILTEGIGRVWVRRLFYTVGIAMIMGGVFVADPAMGFPPGTPGGMATDMSWHATVHGFAPILGFLSLIAAFFILARRFGAQHRPALKWITILVGVGTLILTSVPNFTANWETGEFNFLPLWAGVTIGFFYASFVIVQLKSVHLEGHKL